MPTDLTNPPPSGTTAPDNSATGDIAMLQGPHSRLKELWLLLRANRDFIRGFRGLHFVGPCVTVFGSARFGEGHPYYELGRQVGGRLARMGFTVMTGGGPGLMEAANRGAREAGGRSVGCNIELPREQQPNHYLDRYVTCEHFFVRKVLLFKYSYAFVAMPGGMGTMDELFEALVLIQNKKVEPFPVVMIGTAYWDPLRIFLEQMKAAGSISPDDLRLFLITDDLDEMTRHLQVNAVEAFHLLARKEPTPSALLGESGVQPRTG